MPGRKPIERVSDIDELHQTLLVLDLPGAASPLGITADADGIVPDTGKFRHVDVDKVSEVEDLEQRIRRSVAIRRWIEGGRQPDAVPYQSLIEYEEGGNDRAISQLLRIVRGSFQDMKEGDIIVLPPPDFKGKAQIGELLDVECPPFRRTDQLLRQCFDELPWGADAKQLVEAVDAYLVAEQNVRTVVLKEYNSVLW